MGYDLSNVNNEELNFGFNSLSWRSVLQIAQRYGWKPAGTVDQDEPEWDSTYFSNDGQTVTTEDATALADALERALDDIPGIQTSPKSIVLTTEQVQHDPTFLANQKAMLSIPQSQELRVMTLEEYQNNDETPDVLVLSLDDRYLPAPVDHWSGAENKAYIREFIAFCRAGAFIIY